MWHAVRCRMALCFRALFVHCFSLSENVAPLCSHTSPRCIFQPLCFPQHLLQIHQYIYLCPWCLSVGIGQRCKYLLSSSGSCGAVQLAVLIWLILFLRVDPHVLSDLLCWWKLVLYLVRWVSWQRLRLSGLYHELIVPALAERYDASELFHFCFRLGFTALLQLLSRVLGFEPRLVCVGVALLPLGIHCIRTPDVLWLLSDRLFSVP